MDKADLALLISILSALAAGASAFFTGRLARNDAKRMKRRPIVVERELEDVFGQPEWKVARLRVRNLEPVRVHITGFKMDPPRAKLLAFTAVAKQGPLGGEPELQGEVPDLPVLPKVDYRLTLGVAGTARGITNEGDTAVIPVLVRNLAPRDQIMVEWRWADGLKE